MSGTRTAGDLRRRETREAAEELEDLIARLLDERSHTEDLLVTVGDLRTRLLRRQAEVERRRGEVVARRRAMAPSG